MMKLEARWHSKSIGVCIIFSLFLYIFLNPGYALWKGKDIGEPTGKETHNRMKVITQNCYASQGHLGGMDVKLEKNVSKAFARSPVNPPI